MSITLDDFLFIDEAKVMGYGESDSSGRWVKLLITQEVLDLLRGRKGEILEIAAKLAMPDGSAIGKNGRKQKPGNGPYSEYAQKLYRSAFFRSPEVWRAIGGDADYMEWVRTQPCASCLAPPPSEAAHVRRIREGFGIGHKGATYSMVPLCHAHHIEAQHRHGESALGGKEWFDKERIKHVQKWAWEALKEQLGYEHWYDVPPKEVATWAGQFHVEHLLPAV